MTTSTTSDLKPVRGLQTLSFNQEEKRHPIYKKILRAFEEERALMREQLEHPSNIEQTTLLRGELRHAKRISARLTEVGPESRQSEPHGPESATPALAAERFPMDFEQ